MPRARTRSGSSRSRTRQRSRWAALNVRDKPGMHGTVIAVVHLGDVLDVAGFTHDWAAFDRNGRLGFVHRTLVTAP